MELQLVLDATSPMELSFREWLQATGRAWTHLTYDSTELQKISKRPDLMLQRLAARDVLLPLGGGAYIMPAMHSLAAVDARLSALGEYMISYRTGLIETGWIEGNYENVMTIAVPGGNITRPRLRLGSRQIDITRMTSEIRWFGSEVVTCDGGWYVKAIRERLLLDSLDRPKISGSVVEIRDAWVKALQEGLDWDRLFDYTKRFGYSSVRRVGWWLSQFGFTQEAEVLRDHRGKSGLVLLDASKQYPAPASGWKFDKEWGVRINLPQQVYTGAQDLL